jgi:hypothetical protein
VSASVVQAILAVFGAGGVLGAVVALLKLRPEANSMAVTQAQGAAAEWKKLYDEASEERDELRARAEKAEAELRRMNVIMDRRRSS